MFKKYNRSSQQLVAHCLFIHGQVRYNNYDKYYQHEDEEQVIDHLEMEADY